MDAGLDQPRGQGHGALPIGSCRHDPNWIDNLKVDRLCFNHMVEHRQDRLNQVFAAIADPTRRAIMQRLGKSPARVTDIARDFPISLNAVSKHLKVLQRADLIQRNIRGREHVCSLKPQPLREAMAWIEEMREFWEARLDALEVHLTGRTREENEQRPDQSRSGHPEADSDDSREAV